MASISAETDGSAGFLNVLRNMLKPDAAGAHVEFPIARTVLHVPLPIRTGASLGFQQNEKGLTAITSNKHTAVQEDDMDISKDFDLELEDDVNVS